MDNTNILDALERLTATGVNTYNAVKGQDANVKPTKTPAASAFNWKPVIIIGVIVLVLGGGFLALRKK